MKKLLVILLTLLMIAVLPLSVLAEEAVTSHDPAETAQDISISAVGGADASDLEVKEDAEIADKEDAPKTQFGFFPETLSETLPVMGMGMLGIFLVISVIILAVMILSKIGKPEED